MEHPRQLIFGPNTLGHTDGSYTVSVVSVDGVPAAESDFDDVGFPDSITDEFPFEAIEYPGAYWMPDAWSPLPHMNFHVDNGAYIDVDMDVDNTTMSGYPVPANGDRGHLEELAEATQAVRIFTNVMDDDHDGVPGYADGIDKFGNGQANSCRKFEPMVIEIPNISAFNNVQIKFTYSGSDPDAMTKQGNTKYVLAPGVLRIWKKDGDQVRSPLSAHLGGDFLLPNHSYSPAQLGFGIGDIGDTIKLYVEAVDYYSVEDYSPITVTLYPNDGNASTSQTIRVQPYLLGDMNHGIEDEN